jgi:GNAT superfamily N-acetyltransferase
VAALWERAGVPRFQLGSDAWRTWWASRDADPTLAWGVRGADGGLLGAALARAPERSWSPADLSHIALLAVAPEARRRGIGGALYQRAVAALRERGRSRLRIGAEPERLFPGVPAGAPPETWRFLRRRGLQPGGIEVDCWLDLDDPALARHPLPAGVELMAAAREIGVAFVTRHFPGRWAEEVADAAAAGATILLLRRGPELLGFALARPPLPGLAAAGLAWTATRPWGPLAEGIAGLGPLGLDPAARGEGLGLALVAAAGGWLRSHGASAAVIDWTTLTGFYGRLGARVWRVYQRVEGELGGAASEWG